MEKAFTKKDMVLFFIISLLFFISVSAFDPFISTYAKELGISSIVIGSIIGVTGLASLFTRFPIGIVSDALNKRRIFLQIGLVITAVTWTLAFIAPNSTTLYLGKISDGLTSSTWVIYNVMFASFFGRKEAAKAVAILSVASPAGSLLGSTIGGLIANSYGYQYSFLVAVVAAVTALMLTFFIKEKSVDLKEKYDKKIFVEQVTDRKIWLIAILATIAIMVPFGTRDTFTPLVAKDLGANAIAISWLSNTHLIVYGLAAALCGNFFYKKLGIINTAITGAALQGIIAIVIPYAPNLPTLFVLQAIAGFAFGLIFTVVTSLSVHNIPENKQSTRMGLFQSIYSAGIFFGPVMMGVLTESFSRQTGFLIIGVISLISVIFIKLNLGTNIGIDSFREPRSKLEEITE